jgi:hypothetical protein
VCGIKGKTDVFWMCRFPDSATAAADADTHNDQDDDNESSNCYTETHNEVEIQLSLCVFLHTAAFLFIDLQIGTALVSRITIWVCG